MPIFMYECGSCNKKFEELFLSRKEIEETVDCHFCDSPASKAGVQRFRHIGPVFEDLEHYTNNFYSAKQRADGKAVRSYKDIQKLEAENNFSRLDPESAEYRNYVESNKQEMFEMGQAYNKGSHVGLTDHIYKKEMQDSTGWSDSKYKKWKSAADTAESAARSGKIDVSQAATAKPPATK